MKQRRTIYSIVALVGLIIAGLWYFLSGPSTVSVVEVEQREMPVYISNEANVAALYKANVEPSISGPVTSFSVKVGDEVKQGQVVAVIDTSTLQQQLTNLLDQLSRLEQSAVATQDNELQATIVPGAVSEADVARAQHLMDAGVITEKEYNTIASRAKSTTVMTPISRGGASVDTSGIQAAINQVQEQIGHAQVLAPIDGKVAAIYNEDRKVAVQGKPIMLIQKSTPIVASLTIPQTFAMKLVMPEAKKSMKVYLKVENEMVPGELTYVDTTSPIGTPSVLIKATFNNPKDLLKPGEFYTLVIETNATAPVLAVPKQVVRTGKDGKFVYVLTEDNTVDIRIIEIGEELDGYVPIINGLKKGERIIESSGNFNLGELVKLKEQK